MPGVGATLAYTLLALLPELGQIGRKQIAALVGLAPYAFAVAVNARRIRYIPQLLPMLAFIRALAQRVR